MQSFVIPFDLTFDAAVAHARARGVVLAPEYYAMAAEKRAQAFTVSNLAKLDQVQAVADQLAKMHAAGGTFAEFKRWAKTQNWALPDHRLETIYRNAAQTAYMAGHWRSFEESKDALPYLMYDAINDSRTRPHHLALDGVIKPVGDAWWKTHACPNGHRCRCSIRAISRDEARARGGVTQNVPAEGGADKGWGQDPREWTKTLERVQAQKVAKAHPGLGEVAQQAANAPTTVADFIKAGRSITDKLPDGATDARACHAALIELLEREVGISTPCKVASSGEGAKLVKQASQLYPDAWTKAADDFGSLYTKAKADTRGNAITTSVPPTYGAKYMLRDFGLTPYEQNAGYIMVRKGDLSNATHEYAHRLQSALPELDKLFQELHTSRVASDPVRRIKDVGVKYAHYDAGELTREDHYTNAYQGKEYKTGMVGGKLTARDGGALEVMTMGFESVLGLTTGHPRSQDTVSRFETMYSKDREMFDFVVGLLRHWKP